MKSTEVDESWSVFNPNVLFKRNHPSIKHQEVFNLLKACYTSMPVLGYPNFSCPLELETDASLQGLDTVLSQRDKHSNGRFITYTSHTLQPSKESMRNDILAKLELLALK